MIGDVEQQSLPAIGGYLGKDCVKTNFVTRWIENTLEKKCERLKVVMSTMIDRIGSISLSENA